MIFCGLFASQALAVAHFLDVAKTAGDAGVAVYAERIKVDADVGVAARIHFRAVKDRFDAAIHNLRRMVGCGVGIDEIAALVGLVIRAVVIAVTQGELDVLRDNAVLVGELGLALDFRLFNGLLNCLERLRIVLADEERRAVALLPFGVILHRLRIPDVCIRQADVLKH